jgi:hypothetical protein
MIALGMLLAFLCALTTSLSWLLKYRGARVAPEVSLSHPMRSAAGLVRSRWFAIGMIAAAGAWALHVGALALAPLSLVRAVSAAGLVFVTVLAERFVGCTIAMRQWAGVMATGAGLVLLTITLPPGATVASSYELGPAVVVESTLLGLGAALVALSGRRCDPDKGVVLGTAAGLLFGVCDIAIKALTGAVAQTGAPGLVSPWVLACVGASPLAFYASVRSLQAGEVLPVITHTTVAVNVSTITCGVLVFGDPIPNDPVGIAAQSVAFVLVVTAAALVPPRLSTPGSRRVA